MKGSPEWIDVYVAEVRQIFNSLDPSPFREKDLDPNAEAYIAGWAREAAPDAALGLRVQLDRSVRPEEEEDVREAVHEFFGRRSIESRARLRRLLRLGRTSLAIGLVFLAATTTIGELIRNALPESRLAPVLAESLLIGGWVAMWRPLEIFLYEWWPIRDDARLFDRLSAMPVRVVARST